MKPPSVLDAVKVRIVPFSEKHLNDKRYLEWLHDPEVIKSIGRQEYVLNKVTFEEVKEYVKNMWAKENAYFLAIHDKKTGDFIGTAKIQSINPLTSSAELGIMIGDSCQVDVCSCQVIPSSNRLSCRYGSLEVCNTFSSSPGYIRHSPFDSQHVRQVVRKPLAPE